MQGLAVLKELMNSGSWEAVRMMKQAESRLIDLSISTWQIIIGYGVILLICGYLQKARYTKNVIRLDEENSQLQI